MIKRWMLATVTAMLVLCAGCSRARYDPPATTQIQSTLSGQYGSLHIQATLQSTGQGTLSLLMQQPDSLKGMRFTCRAEGTVLRQYHDLQYPAQQLPSRSLAKVLCTVLDDVSRRADQLTAGTATGKADGAAYLLQYAPDGALLSLSVPELALDVTFEQLQ